MSNTMGKSKIGYRGIGADGRPVDCYFSWSPCGMGCSKLCTGCWARSLAKRVGGAGCPKCAAFEVHFHEERLCQPANTKKPGVVLCNFCSDWLDDKRPVENITAMRLAMYKGRWHNFVTLTQNVFRLPSQEVPGVIMAPRHIWWGVTVRTTAEGANAAAAFSAIRGHKWLSIEPIGEQRIFLRKNFVESLDGAIIGHDNRKGVAGTKSVEEVLFLVKLFRHCGVPIFVKQLFIDGKLRRDPADFPEDLRYRDLPWSIPEGATFEVVK